ncbi:hypothetical protein pb186bvf_014228 [Paramecium bursaria]
MQHQYLNQQFDNTPTNIQQSQYGGMVQGMSANNQYPQQGQMIYQQPQIGQLYPGLQDPQFGVPIQQGQNYLHMIRNDYCTILISTITKNSRWDVISWHNTMSLLQQLISDIYEISNELLQLVNCISAFNHILSFNVVTMLYEIIKEQTLLLLFLWKQSRENKLFRMLKL